VLQVALLCVHTIVSLRPTMRECLNMLSGQMEIPALPQKPATLFTLSSDRIEKSGSFAMTTEGSSARSAIDSSVSSKIQEA
jgi:hypothetical protein